MGSGQTCAVSVLRRTGMADEDLNRAIEQSHAASAAILTGDPTGYYALYSSSDDVTLGNPFGPYVRGRKNVEETLARAATNYRDGTATAFERIAMYASTDLACMVEVERGLVKIGGRPEAVPVSVRVTSVFRAEDGVWRLVHRHADPITTPRPARSVAE
jgi:uncharacterized protein (TIGR02246 family)